MNVFWAEQAITFILCVCEKMMVLARLGVCAGLSEPLNLADAKSTKLFPVLVHILLYFLKEEDCFYLCARGKK